MTDEPMTVAELEALLEGTTPGPWLADQGWVRGPRDVFLGGCGRSDVDGDARRANAYLMAAAPSLAAALIAALGERDEARTALAEAVAGLDDEHRPEWTSDEMKARSKNPLGCIMCWPKDGSWPCTSRMIADDLRKVPHD